MKRKKRRPKSFKSKSPKIEELNPPRLWLIAEGEMEKLGIAPFVRRTVAYIESKFQVLSKIGRIRGGHTVPVSYIARNYNKLSKMILGDKAEVVCAIIDYECRDGCWRKFCKECDKEFHNPDLQGFAVARRSIESWIFGDVEAAISAIKPENKPRQDKYRNVESIAHPVAQEIKKYWPKYEKTSDGVKFLETIRPEIIENHSDSFKWLLEELKRLNKNITEN